ncbi:MAG: RHS repeat-associated core domain-containing protein, partial [Bdellovibrionales bacterium]
FNLRYPGQYTDTETGLSQNWMRDYNPAFGRYVQSDPIGLAAGINTYGYVGGNAVTGVDPRGLDRMSVTFGGQVFLGPFGFSSDTGLGFDTTGNICVVSNYCKPTSEPSLQNGLPIFYGANAALGGNISYDKSNFCNTASLVSQPEVSYPTMIDASFTGINVAGSVTADYSNASHPTFDGIGKGTFGIGIGGALGALRCETRSVCINLNPFH